MKNSWLIGYAELKVHGNWLRRAKGSCLILNINSHELATNLQLGVANFS